MKLEKFYLPVTAFALCQCSSQYHNNSQLKVFYCVYCKICKKTDFKKIEAVRGEKAEKEFDSQLLLCDLICRD